MLNRIFTSTVNFLTFIFLFIISLGSVYYVGTHIIKPNYGSSMLSYCIIYALFILMAALIVILFLYFSKHVKKCENKELNRLCIILFTVFALGQIFVFFSFDIISTNDSLAVQDSAAFMSLTGESKINAYHTDYFNRYTNNNLLVLIFSVIFKIFNVFKIDYRIGALVFNFIMLFIGQVLIYSGIVRLINKQTAVKYLFLTVIDPAMYMLGTWVYSVSLCMPFMGAVLLLIGCIRKSKKDNVKYILSGILGLTVIIGYFIRPVVAILFISLVICCFLWLKKDKKQLISGLICSAVCISIMAVSFLACNSVINAHSDKTDDEFPMTHWVMMGLEKDGTWNSEAVKYTNSFKTKEEKVQANIDKIKKNFKEYSPVGLSFHALRKLTVTWSEGSTNYQLRTQKLNSYNDVYNYLSGDKNDFVLIYLQALRFAVLILACITLFKKFKDKKADASFLLTLFLFGGILFYLIWEAKESYSIPFLFALYALAAQSSDIKFGKVYVKNINKALIGTMSLTLICFAIGFNFWSVQKTVHKEYSINDNASSCSEYVNDLSEKSGYIEQEFYTDKDFNNIEIFCTKKSGNAKYTVDISNADKTVFTKTIGKENFDENKINLNFDTVKNDEICKYTITIKPVKNNVKDSLAFKYNDTAVFKGIKGDLKVSNDVKTNDLKLKVYNEVSENNMNVLAYILIFSLMLSVQVYMFIKLKNANKS